MSSIYIDADLLVNPGVGINGGNNKFTFTFGRDVTTTSTSRISVSNFSVPYSWYNITAANANNQFYYVWFDGTSGNAGVNPTNAQIVLGWSAVEFPQAGNNGVNNNPVWPANQGGTLVPVTIPDGYYDMTTLNSYLQFVMQQNGHYLINTAGNYVYFLEFVMNTSLDRVELHSWQLPQTLPTGWSLGTGVNNGSGPALGMGTANTYPWFAPKIVLWDPTSKTSLLSGTSNTTMFTYFGFYVTPDVTFAAAGTTPQGAIGDVRVLPRITQAGPNTGSPQVPSTGYTVVDTLGDLAPVVNPVRTVVLVCQNAVDNPLRSSQEHSVPTWVITTQNINVKFGEEIVNSNFFTTWIPLIAGYTFPSRQLTFQLLDQEGNPLLLQDPDVNIELLITDLQYN